MGRRDEKVRIVKFQKLLHFPFMFRIAVAMQKHDCDRFDAERREVRCERGNPCPIKWNVNGPVRQQPFANFETQGALNQRIVLLKEQIVGIWPVDAADFVDITKPFSCDQRGFGAAALEQRIDGNRRSVKKNVGIGKSGVRLGDATGNPIHQPARCRKGLA